MGCCTETGTGAWITTGGGNQKGSQKPNEGPTNTGPPKKKKLKKTWWRNRGTEKLVVVTFVTVVTFVVLVAVELAAAVEDATALEDGAAP